jgi:hypothetical protein
MTGPENSSTESEPTYTPEQIAAAKALARETLDGDHAAYNKSFYRTHETGGATPFTPETGESE